MIGKCHHCGIELTKPPFKKNRNTSELLLTLSYRKKIEGGESFLPVKDLGYCELCNASLDELEEQKSIVI